MRSSSRQQDAADGQLARLADEVAALRDLFQRRLFEDKAKNRLYDELCEQLAIARDGLAEQLLTSLFRELLLVIDRVVSLNDNGDPVLDSIAEELLELLERRDVRRVPAASAFDPGIHEAVRTEAVDGQGPGAILEVLRPGYLLGTKLLRAERVIVAALGTWPGEAAAASPADADGYEARLP
jgi:molecular chaperone GrpE